ncbi:MAG: VWA domain-containing protein [Bryobacteraceae bacterium]|jgi:VWFA-related protein
MAITGKLICSLTLAASALLAQAPSSLIRLNVAALDSSGQPVEDLKAADFQVTDQGKAQPVVFFRRNAPAAPAAALAPHEFSNRTGAAPHTTVILFDLLNQNQTDRLDAWHKVGHSLQQLESGDSVYLYLLALEGNLIPIHEIGSKAGDDKTWTQTAEKTLDKAMKAASHALPIQMKDQELVVKKTYVALETLATQLAVFPGQRDIVWITSSTPNIWNTKNPCNGDWVDCALYVPHLAVTLSTANVAVNPLTYTGSPSPELNRDMEIVSFLTGGTSFFSEDIRSVLKALARDAASSYSIFYNPPADNWDSKFHKLRITTERKGLKLRVKQRYYALPRPDAGQLALRAAFQSPLDDPGIGLRVTASPGAGTVHLEIRVNAADLMLHEEGDSFTGGVTFLVADRSAAGPVGDPVISGSAIKLTREQLATAMKDGLPIVQDHPITNAIQTLRVIVLDQGSNIAGSLTIPAR